MSTTKPSASGPYPVVDPDPRVGLLDVDPEVTRAPEIVLRGEGDDPGPYPAGTFRKVGSGMAVLVAMIVATYLVPALQFARPWTSADPVPYWNLIGREILGEGSEVEQAAEQLESVEAIARTMAIEEEAPIEDREVVTPPPEADQGPPPYQAHPDDAEPVVRSLEMASPSVLEPFFAELERTEAGYAGAITRVVHWGDSVIANDNVTSTLRAKMQRRFGDAGHGYHLVAKQSPSYRHKGVRASENDNWSRCHIIHDCKKDGHYGLGGTTATSTGGGESEFATAKEGPNGRKVARFEVWYAGQPRGGRFQLRVDGGDPVVVETASEAVEDRRHGIEVPDGEHRFELRAIGGGQVRFYGVVLERDVPGVVWDGMEQLGAFSSRMLNFDGAHIQRQIEHRKASLLVFEFGGNDLLIKKSQLPALRESFAKMIRTFVGDDAKPACLVVSPVDHGERVGGRIEPDPMVAAVTELQREVALAEGCAFFDTFAAMGGEGAVARWRRANPALISGDLAHLTEAGQRVLGHMIYLALMEAYRTYRQRP